MLSDPPSCPWCGGLQSGHAPYPICWMCGQDMSQDFITGVCSRCGEGATFEWDASERAPMSECCHARMQSTEAPSRMEDQ